MFIETTPPVVPPKLRRSGMRKVGDQRRIGTEAATASAHAALRSLRGFSIATNYKHGAPSGAFSTLAR